MYQTAYDCSSASQVTLMNKVNISNESTAADNINKKIHNAGALHVYVMGYVVLEAGIKDRDK